MRERRAGFGYRSVPPLLDDPDETLHRLPVLRFRGGRYRSPGEVHSIEDADPNDLSFKHATPILDVKSVEDSIDYYISKLGFTRDWDWPDDSEDKTFGSVTNGEVTLFLAETAGPIKPAWVFYEVNDADSVHAAYRDAGVKIREAPGDKPWGMREFLAEDPDGNVLRIASPLRH